MRALTAREMLDVWERGHGTSRIDREMLLAQAALPASSVPEILDLTVGQAEAILLRLREFTFGASVRATADCIHCRCRVEFSFRSGDIQQADFVTPVRMRHRLAQGGYEVVFRPLTIRDLLAIRHHRNLLAARHDLLRRSLLSATSNGSPITADALPAELQQQIGEVLGEQDLQSDVRFRLDCPQCGGEWSAVFDIVPLLWRELSVRAERLLAEVGLLARHYGWSESEILSLSVARRRFYLEAAQ